MGVTGWMLVVGAILALPLAGIIAFVAAVELWDQAVEAIRGRDWYGIALVSGLIGLMLVVVAAFVRWGK